MNGKDNDSQAESNEAPEIEIVTDHVDEAKAEAKAETQEPAPAAANNEEVEKLRADLTKAKNDYLYLMADFENFKKNSIKERSEYLKYGNERLVVELLDIVDNFRRALETEVNIDMPKTVESFQKGIEMTAAELNAVLKKFGVEELDCKGQMFDPTVHEALGSEETDQFDPGYITNVFKQPYKLHDKLIRPGQVIVAKEKTDKE